MEQPVYYWDPVIAPSGAVFYTGDALPGWRGDLLVGSLAPGGLVRLSSPTAASSERSVPERARRAHPRCPPGPRGFVYLLVDSSSRGRMVRLEPGG